MSGAVSFLREFPGYQMVRSRSEAGVGDRNEVLEVLGVGSFLGSDRTSATSGLCVLGQVVSPLRALVSPV